MPAHWQLAALGALPALLAMVYFDRLDAKRPEPRRTLRHVALAGAVCAIPVVVFGQLLAALGLDGSNLGPPYWAAAYAAFVVAAVPEEAGKLASILMVAWRRPEFDERMDGIVYGAYAGLGFALVENVAYLLLLPSTLEEYVSVFIGRAILAVPGHATWGAIIGYYAARKRFDGTGPGMLGGYLIAVTLHGLYDLFLFAAPVAMASGHAWVGLGVLGIPLVAYAPSALIVVGAGLVLRRLVARAIADDDRAERSAGVLEL